MVVRDSLQCCRYCKRIFPMKPELRTVMSEMSGVIDSLLEAVRIRSKSEKDQLIESPERIRDRTYQTKSSRTRRDQVPVES